VDQNLGGGSSGPKCKKKKKKKKGGPRMYQKGTSTGLGKKGKTQFMGNGWKLCQEKRDSIVQREKMAQQKEERPVVMLGCGGGRGEKKRKNARGMTFRGGRCLFKNNRLNKKGQGWLFNYPRETDINQKKSKRALGRLD